MTVSTLASAPRADIGSLADLIGGNGVGAELIDALEQVADLQWPLSVRTYGRMRLDPQLSAVLNAYTLPVRAASWAVDPAGCRDEVVELVADDLGLPVLGVDPEPGPARRRGIRWEEHLRLALLHLTFGHMPFEQRYDIIDGRARLASLSERMPQSLVEIALNRDGTLKGIKQDVAGGRLIDAYRLVWYVHDREGAAWQGRSMLRPAFAPWLLKHEVWRVHATSIRRFGMGVPSVEAPAGGTPAQVAEATRLASAMRVGDQSGAGLPHGFKFNLTGLTGSVPDALAFIRYLDQQMAQMALVSVLNLDASPNGSRALGETFVDLLHTALNAVAGEMAATATGLSVQMVDYNWGENEAAPRVVCSDVADRPAVTAEAIAGLMAAGALTADPELEAWVRQRWQLPARDPDAPPAAAPAQPAPAPAPAPAPPAATRRRRSRKTTAAAPRRQLTLVEAAAGFDPDAVQADWDRALNRLLRDWDAVNASRREQLVEQVAARIDDGDLAALGDLDVNTDAAAETLTAAMLTAAAASASRLADEAATQDVDIDPSNIDVDTDRITAAAAAVAAITGSGLAAAAGREALRIATPTSSGTEVAAAVDTYLQGLSDAYLTEQLGGALTMAQNTGRLAVLDTTDEEPQLVASEILDANVCGPCAQIDGREFASRAEAQEAYASGGYVSCEGRLRCRGILVAVWGDSDG